MISIFNPPPAANPFHNPDLQTALDDACARMSRAVTSSPELQMCIAAGVETEAVTENGVFMIRTVPKVAIVDMGDGTKKIFVRYNDEPPQEASASYRSAGPRRGPVS